MHSTHTHGTMQTRGRLQHTAIALRRILYKEKYKLRRSWPLLAVFNLLAVVYFYIETRHLFIMDHAEVVWYRSIELGHFFYEPLRSIPVCTAIVLAVMQFLPEMRDERLRLSLHLPVSSNAIILSHLLVGSLLLAALMVLSALGLVMVTSLYFPGESIETALWTSAPWFLAGWCAYLGAALALLEPNLKLRIFNLLLTAGFVAPLLMKAVPGTGQKNNRCHRQVLELSVRNLPGHTPKQEFWPLLNTDPAQAGLVFPDDRFRLTDSAMEFINADFNAVDEQLTAAWTSALKAEGFVFPARSVAGNFTILKPFDDGVFVVDSQYAVFHLQRVENQISVTRTPIDPALETRYITVVESTLRQFHGLLLDGHGRLHLLTTDNYKLIALPVAGYDPESMDFKILFDPLYKTCVYSNATTIWAVALDEHYQAIASHTHTMSRAVPTATQKIANFLFPFRLVMSTENSRMVNPQFIASPRFFPAMLLAGLVALALYYCAFSLRHRRRPKLPGMAFVFLTGLYGLISGLLILDE